MTTDADIAAALKTPTIEAEDDRGYAYVETSLAWKQACFDLPCFSLMKWPDYDTRCIEDTIDGQPVVIQLWKGWCENFLGRADFPGGIGGEVGVYQRIPGRQFPTTPGFLPAAAKVLFDAAVRLAHDQLWWPSTAVKVTSSFEFTNPVTKQVFFTAEPEATYWRNRWMQLSSFERYKADVGHKEPWFSTGFPMRATVNGKVYEW